MNKNFKTYLCTSFFILGLFSLSPVFGQEQPGLRERADQLYYEYQYAKAAPIYLKLVEDKKATLQDRERLADSYYKMSNYGEAEQQYAQLVQRGDSGAENLLKYALVLKQNSRYIEAKKVFLDYAEKTGDRTAVANEIAGCDSALVWIAEPTRHVLLNEEGINTERSEFSAYSVGGRIYFASESNTLEGDYGWTGNPYLNLYTVDGSGDGLLSDPVLAKEINKGEYHVGPVSSDREGNTLYVTRTYPVDKNSQIDKRGNKKYLTNRLGLVVYHKSANGEWRQEDFQYNNIEEYSVGHAALSPDGNILYFVSDRPDGVGGTDIWYSEKQGDGSWGSPVNAGTTINSRGDELFPNIAEDGTLYYSSNGLPGMGGLDVFSSTGGKNRWTDAVNLKYPVNSAGDDFSFISSSVTEQGIKGYLSSNRQGGKGEDDIYSFSYEEPKIILVLKGIAHNKDTREVLPEVSVSLYGEDKQLIGKKSSAQDGSVFFELDKESNYKLVGTKNNYFSDSTGLSTKGIIKSDTLFASLYLEPILVVGKTYRLENIHYDFDKYNIRKDAAEILDGLLKTLKENPTLKIELASHTDSRGSDSYNLALSQRRAQAAVDYLVSRGIARDRMVANGYGETRLLNKCANGVACSNEDHQTNRRTEFTVLEF